MDRQGAYGVMALLQANYPESFRGMTKDAASLRLNLWADMFAEEPLELVMAACKAFIATDTKGFMPAVGQIKEQISKMRSAGQDMTPMEAWGIVSKALRNSAYGAQQEFEKLPPDIQRTVGSPSQLKEWAIMDADEVQTVISSNFQRSFKTRQQQTKDLGKLPASVRSFVGRLAAGMSFGVLEAGEDRPDLQGGEGL